MTPGACVCPACRGTRSLRALIYTKLRSKALRPQPFWEPCRWTNRFYPHQKLMPSISVAGREAAWRPREGGDGGGQANWRRRAEEPHASSSPSLLGKRIMDAVSVRGRKICICSDINMIPAGRSTSETLYVSAAHVGEPTGWRSDTHPNGFKPSGHRHQPDCHRKWLAARQLSSFATNPCSSAFTSPGCSSIGHGRDGRHALCSYHSPKPSSQPHCPAAAQSRRTHPR